MLMNIITDLFYTTKYDTVVMVVFVLLFWWWLFRRLSWVVTIVALMVIFPTQVGMLAALIGGFFVLRACGKALILGLRVGTGPLMDVLAPRPPVSIRPERNEEGGLPDDSPWNTPVPFQ